MAQATPPATPPAPTPPAATQAPTPGAQPPVITFSPEGLTLEEALRLALQWDPDLHLQRSTVQSREGALREQGGIFDVGFRASTTYDFRRQELSESRKAFEQEKRDELATGIADNRDNADRATSLIGAVRDARNAPPGSAQVDAVAAIDADIGAQLKIIDALILETTNDQARADLTNARQQYLDRTLGTLEEGLGVALDNFASAETSLSQLGPTPIDEVFYTGRLRLAFAKLFRSGISISPYFDTSMEGTNFAGKPRDSAFGGKGLQDLFTFRFGTNLTLPLMRGRSGDSVAAGERAARVQRDVAELDAQHQQSITALRTAMAYWDLAAAQHTLQIAELSSERQAQIVTLTSNLVEAGDLPRSELSRTQAAQARAQARVRDAQRRLVDARVALATIMGVAATSDETSLPRARDPFPATPPAGAAKGAVSADAQTVSSRPDIEAAVRQEEVGRIFERAAEVDLRPRMDLVGGVWYTALDERTISNAVDRWVGPSTNISLEIDRPFGNNLAEGRLQQSRASLEQSRIATADLRRTTQLQIVRLVESIEEAAERVRLAEVAVQHYNSVVDAEVERFRIREANLIDTLLTESQQADARLQLVNAQRDLARLLAELRYETGTLVVDGNVAAGELGTLPTIRR